MDAKTRMGYISSLRFGKDVAFLGTRSHVRSPTDSLTIGALERLKSRSGDLYTEENVAISWTHTHTVYSVTSLGFVQQSFDAIVNAIEQSIVQAHQNLKPGSIFINIGLVEDAGINRSPSAYLENPPEERAKYAANVDKEMTLLKFMDSAAGKSIGAFNWYATHGTSTSRNNRFISGDNKGAAARFLEDWFTSTNKPNSPTPTTKLYTSSPDVAKLISQAQTIKATGGHSCNTTTSQSFKVRKNDGSLFVGAFCQSNVGDVTPNVLGAFCIDSGNPCCWPKGTFNLVLMIYGYTN